MPLRTYSDPFSIFLKGPILFIRSFIPVLLLAVIIKTIPGNAGETMIFSETERLWLRPFCLKDLGLILRLYTDPEILRYTPFDVMSLETAELHLAKIVRDWELDPQHSFEFAMIRKEDGEPVGRCHILIDPETDTGMIGWLIPKEHWGKHYAFESGEALIHCCFEPLGLHRVNAVCNPNNMASRRVLERLGLHLEAHYRKKCLYRKNGIARWEDELEYARLKEEVLQND